MITDKMREKWQHQKDVVASAIENHAIHLTNWERDFFPSIQLIKDLSLRQE